jgi:hypothetical protein
MSSKRSTDLYYPQITQINADYFFKLLADPQMARVFRGSKLKAEGSKQKRIVVLSAKN